MDRSSKAMQQEWRQKLENVSSTEDVVWVVREFLATWTPEQIEALPAHCRPGKMSDPDDVSIYAFTLVQHQCKAGPHEPELQAMATFFAAAASRLSTIFARARRASTTSRLFSER